MRCTFCDVHKYGFFGNVSRDNLAYQIRTILEGEPDTKDTARFNVHYARMGEPTFNSEVIDFTLYDLDNLVSSYISTDTIHPVVSTMLPKSNKNLVDFIQQWCIIKNQVRQGEAGLQFSINSTDDRQRERQFAGMSLSLAEIS